MSVGTIFDPDTGTREELIGTGGRQHTISWLWDPVGLTFVVATKVAAGGGGDVNITNASLAVTGAFYPATQPVSGTFWQATQPISGAVSFTAPQHVVVDSSSAVTVNTIAGFALEAGHLATIDTSTAKIPSQGQALAAASMPVVLTAAQIVTLTPPAAIAGFSLEAGHIATIDTKTPALGQALAAAAVPVVLTAIQQTALTPPAAITGFSLEAGHIATIDAKIPALGQALAAASVPVVLTAIQVTALTPPAAIVGFALDATLTSAQAVVGAAAAPAKMFAVGGVYNSARITLTTGQSSALQLDADGTLYVNVTDLPVLTKGTQGTTGASVQALKDAGRVNIMWTLEFAPAAVAEALMTMTESRDGAAVTTFTSKIVTTGKRLRITSMGMTVENTLGVNPKRAKLRMKFNTAAAVTTASPLQANLVASVSGTLNTVGVEAFQEFPDGIEYLGDGTKQIGFTLEFPDWVTVAQTGKVYVTIFGFEY